MTDSGLEKAVTELTLDKCSGATALASKAIDIYIQYIEDSKVLGKKVFLGDLLHLGLLLAQAQPSMVSISNVVEFVSKQYSRNISEKSLPELRILLRCSLVKFKTELMNAKKQLAQNALSCIPDNAVIITLSDSSTVEEVIKQAHFANKVSMVIIAESRPLLEGLNLADRLIKGGIPVTVIVDAALGFFCKEADLAVVGADTIQKDGSLIHKVGTYPFALACHDLRKPFYVTCDTLKFSKTATCKKPVKIELKPPAEILSQNTIVGAEIRNIYFDMTPAKYITRIVTEKGIFSPNKLHVTV
jgi:translation initiation factor eIF-2B subunit delta